MCYTWCKFHILQVTLPPSLMLPHMGKITHDVTPHMHFHSRRLCIILLLVSSMFLLYTLWQLIILLLLLLRIYPNQEFTKTVTPDLLDLRTKKNISNVVNQYIRSTNYVIWTCNSVAGVRCEFPNIPLFNQKSGVIPPFLWKFWLFLFGLFIF